MENEDKAHQVTDTAIVSYNTKRPHLSINGHTPGQKHGEGNWNQGLSTQVLTKSSTKKVDVKAVQDYQHK